MVWSIGRLARPGGRKGRKEPSFHHTYPKEHVEIDFKGPVPELYECRSFVQKAPYSMARRPIRNDGTPQISAGRKKTWGPHRHFDYSLRTFDARLGPPGGEKGYTGITGKLQYNDFI